MTVVVEKSDECGALLSVKIVSGLFVAIIASYKIPIVLQIGQRLSMRQGHLDAIATVAPLKGMIVKKVPDSSHGEHI